MKLISSRRRPLRRAASPAGITIIRGQNITAQDEAEMLEALLQKGPKNKKPAVGT